MQAVFLVGRFNVTKLHTTVGSPFNVATPLAAPLFSKEEVQVLFAQFAEERSIKLAPAVVDDIYRQTCGA